LLSISSNFDYNFHNSPFDNYSQLAVVSYYNYFSTVLIDLNNSNGVVYHPGTGTAFNKNDITGSLDIPPFKTAKIYLS